MRASSSLVSLLALASVLLVLLSSLSCRADLVTVRLEPYGEAPPGHLCVVAEAFARKQGAGYGHKPLVPGRVCFNESTKLAEAPCADVRDECASRFTVLKTTDSSDAPGGNSGKDDVGPPYTWPTWDCRENASAAGSKVVILQVQNAIIESYELSGNVVRLDLTVRKEKKALPIELALIGGDYYPRTPVAFRLRDATQMVEMPLKPRCVSRLVRIPEHNCAEDADQSLRVWTGRYRDRKGESEPVDASGSRAISVNVYNPPSSLGSIKLGRCGHEFQSGWTGAVPPAELEVDATSFWFDWHRSCLAPPDECPRLQMQASVTCEGTLLGDRCHYVCGKESTPEERRLGTPLQSPSVRFPTNVRFSFSRQSVTSSWQESLSFPGETLYGYIPAEQRRVQLRWDWKEPDREQRAKWSADEIYWVELRTPEGKIHRIHYNACQVRVPELDCHDHLSYRYVGTRQYKEVPSALTPEGEIVLEEPSKSSADDHTLAWAVGGGMRCLSDVSSRVRWAPNAEVELMYVNRHSRTRFHWKSTTFDWELRVGAVLTLQPHCSRMVDEPGGADCPDEGWTQVYFWRFPMTPGVTANHGNWLFSLGFGAALTSYVWSRDADHTGRPLLFTAYGSAGYRFVPAMALEGNVRLFLGEEVRETVFDEAGFMSYGELQDGTGHSLFINARLRMDDLL